MWASVRITPPYGARSALREATERAGVRVRRRIGMRLGLESLGLSRLRVLWPGRRRTRPSGRARGYAKPCCPRRTTGTSPDTPPYRPKEHRLAREHR
eukprot:7129033-Prymnesium_polylepis.1